MEYVITIIVVILITIFQVKSFLQTKKTRAHFETIFPQDAEKELLILKKEGVQIVSKELYDIKSQKTELESSINVCETEIQKLQSKIERYKKYQAEAYDTSVYELKIKETSKELANYRLVNQGYKNELKALVQRENQLSNIGTAFQNETRVEIINSINRYLESNKNSVTDFNLIRDIIDRNCDAVEEEIQAQIPIPIYFGLIGTMIGIILGAGSLVVTGALWNLLTPFTAPLGVLPGTEEYKAAYEAYNALATNGILTLFGGVAIATTSSIIGIILTIIGSNKGKDTKSTVESRKHAFISWLQAELLPKISSDFSSALIKLGHDLTGFNNSFSSNANLLKKTLSEIGQATSAQATLVQTIEKIDISKIATANIEVYNQLKNCTSEIAQLATDLKDIQNSIRGLGQYMHDGINDYHKRETYIKDASGKVDIAISNGQEKLSNATDAIFQKYDELLHTLYMQTENTTKELAKKYDDQAERLHNAIVEKLTDVKRIEDELRNLVAIKTTMGNLEKATQTQNQKIDSLAQAIRELAQVKITGGTPHVEMKMPSIYKVAIIAACSIISVASLFFIVLRILEITGVIL